MAVHPIYGGALRSVQSHNVYMAASASHPPVGIEARSAAAAAAAAAAGEHPGYSCSCRAPRR